MKKTIALIAIVLSTPALAADRTPWREPPEASVSPTGTVIAVENIRCEVASPYQIRCLNVGRVCVAYRARKEKENAASFGCAIEGSPNYPCKPWEDTLKKIDADDKLGMSACMSMSLGHY